MQRHRPMLNALAGCLLGVFLFGHMATMRSAVADVCPGASPLPGAPGDACSDKGTMLKDAHVASQNPSNAAVTSGPGSSAARLGIVPVGPPAMSDMVEMAKMARRLLDTNRVIRESISPYRTEGTNYEQLVRRFEIDKDGFEKAIDYWEPAEYNVRLAPNSPENQGIIKKSGRTIAAQLDQSEADLRRAWTLYAYLAVSADKTKFKEGLKDSDPVLQKSDCSLEQESEFAKVGQTWEYSVQRDYCDFGARMRESVREAAYLHMIFAQQLFSDATRVMLSSETSSFGANFDWVKRELDQLNASLNQYEKAQNAVTDAFDLPLGPTCTGSDLFTEVELDLQTRINTGKVEVLREIATRNSYAETVKNVEASQDAVRTRFRQTAVSQYLQLASLAALRESPAAQRCGYYAPTNLNHSTLALRRSESIAEMASRLGETIGRIRSSGAGVNIFGFDVEFTPDLPADTLETQLVAALRVVKDSEAAVIYKNREYETSVAALQSQVQAIRNGSEGTLRRLVGCPEPANVEQCIADLSNKLTAKCFVQMPPLDQIKSSEDYSAAWPDSEYASCAAALQGSDIGIAYDQLRTEYLKIVVGQAQVDTLRKRKDNEISANTKIKGLMKDKAELMSADVYAETYISGVTQAPGTVAQIGGVMSGSSSSIGGLSSMGGKSKEGLVTNLDSSMSDNPTSIGSTDWWQIIAAVVGVAGGLMSAAGGKEEKGHPYCRFNDVDKFIDDRIHLKCANHKWNPDPNLYRLCKAEVQKLRDLPADQLEEMMCPLGTMRKQAIMRQALKEIEIVDARSQQAVADLFAQISEAMVAQRVNAQLYQTAWSSFLLKLRDVDQMRVEWERSKRYVEKSPANDPSFHLIMDEERRRLADATWKAKQWAYLYARRAEYEVARSLDDSGQSIARVSISNIYRARTAEDIGDFQSAIDAFRTGSDNAFHPQYLTIPISVAEDVLFLPDDGNREASFQEWARANLKRTSSGGVLREFIQFTVPMPIASGGVLSREFLNSYYRNWGFQMDRRADKGIRVRVRWDGFGRTPRTNLVYRTVQITQAGLQQKRAFDGCVIDYRLVHPGFLLGYRWPPDEDPEKKPSDVYARVETCTDPNLCQNVSTAFAGRPVASTDWQFKVYTTPPATGYDPLDLDYLTDIEINFDVEFSSRQSEVEPPPSECLKPQY